MQCPGSLTSKHVGDRGSMADFLICHVLEKVNIIVIHAYVLKLLARELGNAVVEQVQLNELLVER